MTLVSVGVMNLSHAWHNSVLIWTLEGIVGALVLMVLALELAPMLRRRLGHLARR